MNLRGLRSWPGPAAARTLLVCEVFGYVAVLWAYVWFALPPSPAAGWHHAAFFIFAGTFPVCMNLLHGDRPADSGIRLDNLVASAKETGVGIGAMGVVLAAAGLAAGGFHWVNWGRFGDKCVVYAAWGPVQQYLLQAFAVRRFRQAKVPAWIACLSGAVLFGLLHSPNWPLVALATAAGVVWAGLFLRHPNIITLGVGHGVLAVLAYHALPVSWLENLTIGGLYLQRMAAGGG